MPWLSRKALGTHLSHGGFSTSKASSLQVFALYKLPSLRVFCSLKKKVRHFWLVRYNISDFLFYCLFTWCHPAIYFLWPHHLGLANFPLCLLHEKVETLFYNFFVYFNFLFILHANDSSPSLPPSSLTSPQPTPIYLSTPLKGSQ